jgi:hypothetical protein
MTLRWDPCVVQDAAEFRIFLSEYVDRVERRCLIIGGAGFDPRAILVPQEFSTLQKCKIDGFFFREERLLDQPLLRPFADNVEKTIRKLLPSSIFPRIDIFSDAVTAVGGRRALDVIKTTEFNTYTDVFVDISALSCGVFFSIISFLISMREATKDSHFNIHVLVAEQPEFDRGIRGVPADAASMLHGFKGVQSLDASENATILWIPTLTPGHTSSLGKIFAFIQRRETPIDVCPIVPFPGADPRLPDRLVDEYREDLVRWRADHRDFLYAAESDPLDSYRAISTLCTMRDNIFGALGGSQVVLSPLGNKMLSIGALLAAIEKRLPVVMVESIGYDECLPEAEKIDNGTLKHVWLYGEAYGQK